MGLLDFASRRVIQPLWARREDRRAAALRDELDRRQFDPPAVVRARQVVALWRMLRHAAATVPYYRDLFARVGFDVGSVQSIDVPDSLPILTKADIRRHGDQLVSEAFRGASLTRKTTSGSTGVPLEVWLDGGGLSWKRACTLRCDEWSGWRRGGRVAKVWGNPDYRRHGVKGWLRNALYERALHLDTLSMTPDAIRQFIARFNRMRPELLFGHAHSVYLLADFVDRLGIKAHRPAGIITTAMVLHDWQRRRIEATFGCPVTNRYGCEEVSLISCECGEHRGLHVNADSVLVEIVRDGKTASPGTPGSIVVTDLSNFAMPLIRYLIGDVGVLADRHCPCGRGSMLLESIEGREADYVVTADGRLISGISLTENFAVLVPGVAQIQIVQEQLRRFVFRIVRGPNWGPASQRKLSDLVSDRFGKGVRFALEFVDLIPQEPSGKYRFCISHVSHPSAAEGGRIAA
ncbi:MAG TPA: phenylacetate--CoA ligase family protein [Gemmataceae bacterium]|nr:phenylacetate--CoA ligase family protein [Gemmataceae bacterium]